MPKKIAIISKFTYKNEIENSSIKIPHSGTSKSLCFLFKKQFAISQLPKQELKPQLCTKNCSHNKEYMKIMLKMYDADKYSQRFPH